ncbi:MAG: VWA domain-containing protein, partial [Pyrinomonadaceae bacterium]|nr:VWA domain-containing protein [Pyrinomonadaceae bacterium]
AIWDGERRLSGEVRSREEARRIYDEIVRRQRDPGLLEYVGKDLFQASIFPIPPRSDKKLELTYTQVLRAESGTVAYRYPLGTGRNLQPIGRVSGRIEIDSREPLRNIYSPSHAIETARKDGERRAHISFENEREREPQDFRLFYSLSREDFGLSLVTHREPGKAGFYLLMISPRNDWATEQYAAKDVVFVLDTSGSMADEGKMEKARAALLSGVRNLRASDRFNIVSFAGEEHLMASGMITADDAGRARGADFVRGLRPVGGTNINDALVAALRLFDQQMRPKLLVFMTDGLPTVGETNINRIIENARAAGTPGVRLFTFGVGYDVNTSLLDKLAAENSGVADYIEPKEDLEVKVSNFFTKVNHPVLTDLKLDMGGVETDLIYPRNLPDLFRGSQLTLIGRYRNAGDMRNVRLRLTGRVGGNARTFAYDDLQFPLTKNDHEFLPRLWATRRVGWLMEQIRTNGEQRELRDEIVDLGTRYGIVTPYTSYLALEPGQESRPIGPPVPLPINGRGTSNRALNEDNRATGTFRSTRRPSSSTPATGNAELMRMDTGRAAVQQSKDSRAQQETIIVQANVAQTDVRSIGGKTFYLREGVWIDAEFKAESGLPETPLVFGSDDYFALLRREPRLAEFFALGERVVVVFKDRVYRVGAATSR